MDRSIQKKSLKRCHMFKRFGLNIINKSDKWLTVSVLQFTSFVLHQIRDFHASSTILMRNQSLFILHLILGHLMVFSTTCYVSNLKCACECESETLRSFSI